MPKQSRKRLWVLALCCLMAIGGAAWYHYEERRAARPVVPTVVKGLRESLKKAKKRTHTIKRRVIAISIDGLRSDAITKLGPKKLPTFFHLMREGASTLNARTDHDYTITLPNHTSMLTGRWVAAPKGHGYIRNGMPGETLHQRRGSYVASFFDVAHDHGLITALFASKAKFVLFPNTYGAKAGAPDRVPPDHGRAKLDIFAINRRDPPTIQALHKALTRYQPHVTFVHLRGPDTAGHWWRWMSSSYLAAVVKQDGYLKQLIALIKATSGLAGQTTLLITTDHGGSGRRHGRNYILAHYRIPFFAWGAGVKPGADLYKLNPKRVDPGKARVPPSATKQPIRNGDIANAITALFRLPPVPGSQHGFAAPLRLR